MVIRDLTLRSAASFGSFHLIRLLYDEYMFYLIEHQVAIATGTTPIAVMGDVWIFKLFSLNMSHDSIFELTSLSVSEESDMSDDQHLWGNIEWR